MNNHNFFYGQTFLLLGLRGPWPCCLLFSCCWVLSKDDDPPKIDLLTISKLHSPPPKSSAAVKNRSGMGASRNFRSHSASAAFCSWIFSSVRNILSSWSQEKRPAWMFPLSACSCCWGSCCWTWWCWACCCCALGDEDDKVDAEGGGEVGEETSGIRNRTTFAVLAVRPPSVLIVLEL